MKVMCDDPTPIRGKTLGGVLLLLGATSLFYVVCTGTPSFSVFGGQESQGWRKGRRGKEVVVV